MTTSSDTIEHFQLEAASKDVEHPDNDVGNKTIVDQWMDMSPIERERYEKKLVRKLDFKLIPPLTLLYLLSFIDRANIGNAKIQGLVVDLNLTPTQYGLCLTVFFIFFSLAEVPSNILLKRLKPHIWLPAIMVGWGITTISIGFVRNFSGLAIARAFLGLTEAGLFPGVHFYLSCWYKRNELGLRAALFYSAAPISGAFGGLAAAGIANLNGVGGKPGWAWIFILEGIVTTVIGFLSFWFIVDFPDDPNFLNPLERHVVISRLKQDGQASHRTEMFRWKYVLAAYKDWKLYVGMIIASGLGGAVNAFSLFLPSIINELGFTSTHAQLLTVPPYMLAFVMCIVVGFAADRSGVRGVFNIVFGLVGCVGFSILIASRHPNLSYAATFLCAIGIFPSAPNSIAWMNNNVQGVYKRGVAIANFISWANINGIMSSNVYRQNDAPWYRLGNSVILGYVAVGIVGGSIANYIFLSIGNRRRDAAGEYMKEKQLERLSEEEKENLADFHPDFRYTL